ncbi:MAG: hypothetical protein KZQ81_04480 [Candidatus Thiodiazotropha sp. (ex Rostrolucina anterorostrata)]|nr:hypothetical protein [Candidatus Thiodiazotropha sp. (ex Rostrolucina anterorostrata)]
MRNKDARRISAGFRIAMDKGPPKKTRDDKKKYYCFDGPLRGRLAYQRDFRDGDCLPIKLLENYIEKNGLQDE